MTPSKLAPRLQSLPPILHKPTRSPLPSYSKGAQGLSVLPRVDSICAVSSISLSLLLRQYGNRYAIRAGRNLPDKEFRSCFPLISQRHGLYLYPFRDSSSLLISSALCFSARFIPDATSIILMSPGTVRWAPSPISRTTSLNLMKSNLFCVCNEFV